MSVHVFGIRHHGPGCARALRAALEALGPDLLLVEGPPDADGVLPLAHEAGMRPPVALLVYPKEAPARAVFYPFADFSPEWQALQYALRRRVPVRFLDLALTHWLARTPEGGAAPDEPEEERVDAIGLLAEAAGSADPELWWEQQVERRRDVLGLFESIREAMTAVRAEAPPPTGVEALREASMRTRIRAALEEGFQRVAVVCGAWHVPALAERGPAKADAVLLKGLPRTPVEATWIPWTHSRLTFRSGYGAGVHAPGWYRHLWTHPEGAAIRWAAEAARLLRGEDLDASSASVIEAVRLAEGLAAMRGLSSPGLAELNDALLSVLCHGEPAPLRLIRERLEVGDVLGEVPEGAPQVPLQRDLQAQAKTLRLKASPEAKMLDLDLREEGGRERSRLFHRLVALGVHWAVRREERGRKTGTFHEVWELRWRPELDVSLIEASVWGHTLEAAAAARLRHEGDGAKELARLTELLDAALLAELPEAVEHLLAQVQAQAAVAADVQHLMEALPPLARVSRYGDVRGRAPEALRPVLDALFARVVVGLPGACASLDDEAAGTRLEGMVGAQRSVELLERADLREDWQAALHALVERDGVHGRVRGGACRLLVEQGALAPDALQRLAGLALSHARPAPESAAWVEGLVEGSGLVLLHHDGLWTALDRWLAGLTQEAFTELLPLVRRAFSGFQPPERRAMGEKVKRLGSGAAHTDVVRPGELGMALVRERADAVLPVLARVLGVPGPGGKEVGA
ncbi:MAG: DUF5682 family protein [Myxococcaceae bacterium]|nr:DUF5682 family protein [Myxococcaceae bacterium]MCI0673803.1 DUF5682 family protein [Myxococcaceae bacterium]